jgi:hypothetical protein
MLDGQLVEVVEKLPGLVPVKVKLKAAGPVPELVRVSVLLPIEVLICTLPKA